MTLTEWTMPPDRQATGHAVRNPSLRPAGAPQPGTEHRHEPLGSPSSRGSGAVAVKRHRNSARLPSPRAHPSLRGMGQHQQPDGPDLWLL